MVLDTHPIVVRASFGIGGARSLCGAGERLVLRPRSVRIDAGVMFPRVTVPIGNDQLVGRQRVAVVAIWAVIAAAPP